MDVQLIAPGGVVRGTNEQCSGQLLATQNSRRGDGASNLKAASWIATVAGNGMTSPRGKNRSRELRSAIVKGHSQMAKFAPRSSSTHIGSVPPRSLVPWASTEAEMARDFTTGKAQTVTTQDFNEQVKRLFADKSDPRAAEQRTKNLKGNTPFQKG